MTKRQARKIHRAIAFWGNGGTLWYYDRDNEWKKHDEKSINFNKYRRGYFIMEDENFEKTKASFIETIHHSRTDRGAGDDYNR